jgi:RNA polymerase sigma-70 factor (ECF subfamily)
MERMLDADYLLVVRAQRGDRAAFEELVRRTSRLVFARVYLETGDSHQAEDIVQDTLLTAYRTLGQLTQPEKFRAWLLRIAQNNTLNVIRHNNCKKRTPEPEILKLRQQAILSVVGPAEQAEQDELKQKVLVILRDMPEEYRLPLTLRYLVGADYETIQTQMGLSKAAVRGLLHRGLQRLRVEMHKVLGEACPELAGRASDG